jgi:hypothetical protein
MQIQQQLSDTSAEPLKVILKRFFIVVVFSVAFAYIEAAVVVYLRAIFHPSGFVFPMPAFGISPLWKRLLLTEIGREAATLVLILTGSWLIGRTLRQRFAFFLTIFAIWDIFYYVWLKVLLDWPASIMDWDILFLIPTVWAGPVIAPVIISLILLAFAIILLCCDRIPKTTLLDWCVFIIAALLVVVSFCIAGLHIAEPGFKSHFNWLLFVAGPLAAVVLFAKYLLKCK